MKKPFDRPTRLGRLRLAFSIALIGFGASVTAVACGSEEPPQTPAEPPATPPPPPQPEAVKPPAPPPPPAEPALDDNQIAAIVTAANGGEIEQAKLAKTNAKDAKVKKFAAMMIDHHGKNQQDAMALGKKLGLAPAPDKISEKLDADSRALIDKLRSEKGADFDRDYIAAQVDNHKAVLGLFNDKLIPAAKHAELKDALNAFKPKIEAHLKDAEAISASLPPKK